MRTALRLASVWALLGAAACAGVVTSAPGPEAANDRPIRIEALAVPLGVGGARLAPGVRYAGGLSLRGPDLQGLSDLKIAGDRAWAVSDFGELIRFTLRLDRRGRLDGAEAAVSRILIGLDGSVLAAKADADAEGLVLTPDGGMLVSFEGDHRIWAYEARDGARPIAVARPDVDFGRNEGLEGLAAAPDGGWLAMGETGGAWVCHAVCRPLGTRPVVPADGYRFTGADRDPAGGWFVVERFWRPPFDMRARVRRLSLEGVLSEPLIELRPPASTDNFEGIAAVKTPSGTRLYLLSDDNANPFQKTLLMAFDVDDFPSP